MAAAPHSSILTRSPISARVAVSDSYALANSASLIFFSRLRFATSATADPSFQSMGFFDRPGLFGSAGMKGVYS
jgi:hypothetical protein